MSENQLSHTAASIATTAFVPNEVKTFVSNAISAHKGGLDPIVIWQDELVVAFIEAGVNRAQIFSERMLDFEQSFREGGWRVEYYKADPDGNESAKWQLEPEKPWLQPDYHGPRPG